MNIMNMNVRNVNIMNMKIKHEQHHHEQEYENKYEHKYSVEIDMGMDVNADMSMNMNMNMSMDVDIDMDMAWAWSFRKLKSYLYDVGLIQRYIYSSSSFFSLLKRPCLEERNFIFGSMNTFSQYMVEHLTDYYYNRVKQFLTVSCKYYLKI